MPADATVTISAEDEVELSENVVLMIPAGQTMSTGVVTVSAIEDSDNYNEVVSVRATPSADSDFLGQSSTNLYVIDDDHTDTVLNVSPVPQRMREGDTSTVLVELNRTHTEEVTVVIGVDEEDPNHDATAADYTLSANRTLTIPAGSMRGTGTVSLTATDDEYYGPLSTVSEHRELIETERGSVQTAF